MCSVLKKCLMQLKTESTEIVFIVVRNGELFSCVLAIEKNCNRSKGRLFCKRTAGSL